MTDQAQTPYPQHDAATADPFLEAAKLSVQRDISDQDELNESEIASKYYSVRRLIRKELQRSGKLDATANAIFGDLLEQTLTDANNLNVPLDPELVLGTMLPIIIDAPDGSGLNKFCNTVIDEYYESRWEYASDGIHDSNPSETAHWVGQLLMPSKTVTPMPLPLAERFAEIYCDTLEDATSLHPHPDSSDNSDALDQIMDDLEENLDRIETLQVHFKEQPKTLRWLERVHKHQAAAFRNVKIHLGLESEDQQPDESTAVVNLATPSPQRPKSAASHSAVLTSGAKAPPLPGCTAG